jgi:hypothetical protein
VDEVDEDKARKGGENGKRSPTHELKEKSFLAFNGDFSTST